MTRRAELVRRVGVVSLVAVRVGPERVARDPLGPAASLLLANERCDRATEKPRHECAVEQLELVVAGDERLPEGEVDVVLAGEVHRVEAAHRILHTPGPDFDPNLA